MFQDYIIKGGIEWMLPIVFLSVIALALAMERAFFWCCYFSKNRQYRKNLKKINASSFSIERAIEYLSDSSHPVMKALHLFLKQLKQSNVNSAEEIAGNEVDRIVTDSRAGLDVLTFIANVSGTLGLLGTVVGVSMALEDVGLGDPTKLTEALSIALYTTVAGVMLFLFSYFFFFLFNKFSNGLESELVYQVNTIKSYSQIRSSIAKR
ncbi:MAG: MotA/TolQ/ExbB proton channel family protein [Planctomycetota bacterium]